MSNKAKPSCLDAALAAMMTSLGLDELETSAALEASQAKPVAKPAAKDDGYRVPVGPARRRSGRPGKG